jgi:phosphoadenylyl-sulfate reductase (thioredoxin)
MADATEIDAAASELEGADATSVLRWASGRFAPLGFATGLGVEGCVLLDLAARAGLALDVFTLDTGLLFAETYELWRRLEARYGITIRAVRPPLTVEQQNAAHGDALWARDPDACCRMRKVEPLAAEVAAAGFPAWISAIRRDQTPERAGARVVELDRRFGIVKVNPLVRWTDSDIWRHALDHDVPYNPLHDQGFPSIGCAPCTTAVAPGENPRAGRWRGTAKTECGLHLPVVHPRERVPERADSVQAGPAILAAAGRSTEASGRKAGGR